MSSIGEFLVDAIKEISTKVEMLDDEMEDLIITNEMYNCNDVFHINKKGKIEIETDEDIKEIDYEVEINVDNPEDYHKDIEIIVKKLTRGEEVKEPMLSIKNY